MEKIKKLFDFIGRAWRGGFRGKIGILAAMFAMLMLGRMFFGDVSVQRFIVSAFHLGNEYEQLALATAELENYERHMKLIQNYSPDYIEELGLKYLNIGDANIKILKI